MDTNFETIKLNPRRVYHCDHCNRTTERKDTGKRNGEFFCRLCGGKVRDVTDTDTGHDFMELVLI